MVTRSRKRRETRVLTVRRNQVAAADTARPNAAACTIPGRCATTPSPSSISHKARSASGSAASCDSAKEATINRGSWRNPSLHSRHMDDSAGGNGSMTCSRSGEDVIGSPLFLGNVESLRLEIEHRAIASAKSHEFGVGPQFDDLAVLQHADSIGVADG